jgi:hypothetical protein
MKSLAAGTLTALAQPSVPIVQLVHMAFSSPVALNTSTMDLVYGGVTYKGAYGLGSIGAVKDSPGEIKGLQFTLSGVSAASISLALDGGDVWQGCVVTIRTAILDANYAVTEAPIEWTGAATCSASAKTAPPAPSRPRQRPRPLICCAAPP